MLCDTFQWILVEIFVNGCRQKRDRLVHAALDYGCGCVVMSAATELFHDDLYVDLARGARGYADRVVDTAECEGSENAVDGQKVIGYLSGGDTVCGGIVAFVKRFVESIPLICVVSISI